MTTSLNNEKYTEKINIFPNIVGEEKTENDAIYHEFKEKQKDYKQKTKELRVMMNNVLKKRDDLIKKNPGADKIDEIQNEFIRLDYVLQKLETFKDLTPDELTLFTGGKRRKSRRNRKSKKTRKSRNNRRKSKRTSRR
jgi:hypothetical protein